MQNILIILFSTFAFLITLDAMRKCYNQKEWLWFAVEALMLIAVVVAIIE
jgi:hypothetical protein